MCILLYRLAFMFYLNYRPQLKYISNLCTLSLTIKSKFRSHYSNSVLLTIMRLIFLYFSPSKGRSGMPGASNKKMILFRSGAKCLPFCDFPFCLLSYCFLCPSLSLIELLRFQIQNQLLTQLVALLHINW